MNNKFNQRSLLKATILIFSFLTSSQLVANDFLSQIFSTFQHKVRTQVKILSKDAINLGNSPAVLNNKMLVPNLLIDVSVNNTAPGGNTQFCYKIRYRCASITEHCMNSQIAFQLHPSMEITRLPSALGNISNVNRSGNQVTISLASPASAGVPAGALAAGSAGLIEVCARFRCVDDAAPTVAGNMVNFASNPTFSVSGGSVSDGAPNILVPTLRDCTISLPPNPPSNFAKSATDYTTIRTSFPGSFAGWKLEIPTHNAPFSVTDDFPTGFRLADFDELESGYTLEVDCGGGYRTLASGNSSSQNDLDDDNLDNLNAGDFVPDISGSNTGCIVQIWTAVDGSTVPYIENSVSMRLNIPANDIDGANYNFVMRLDEDVPCGTYQNIATTSIPGTFPEDGENLEVYCTEFDLDMKTACTEVIGNGLTDFSNFNTVHPYFTVDPLDMQFRIQIPNSNNAPVDIDQGFVIEALLDEELNFITDPDNPNYWIIFQDPGQVQPPPTCLNPNFELIPNHTGTRTLLRWTFPPSCILRGGYTDNFSSNTNGDTEFPEIFFSARYNLTNPIPGSLGFDATGYLSDGALFGNDESVATSRSTCSTPNYSSVNSAKYVQGALDNEFHRFPIIGNTNVNGDGDYELFFYQSGFDNITDLHLVDILPYIGDKDMLTPSIARESDWSAQLTQAITVERFKIGMGLIDASGDLGPNGVYYSTSTNPCFLNGSNDVLVTGVNGTDPSCNAFTTGGTAAGARSWAFHWSNTGDPLVFGEFIKVTMQAEQLTGESTMSSLEVAWNSFVFSSTNSNGDVLTSQPIKTGLRIVDENAFSTIGGTIWKDANGNGLQDVGEDGIGGVTILLYNADGTPVEDMVNLGGVVSGIQRTTISDSNSGAFCFAGLSPSSNYVVRLENTPEFTGSGPLAGLTLTLQDAGMDDDIDSDATLSNGGGLFAQSDPEILGITSPAAGEKTNNFSFGFYQAGEICGHAWIDADGEGDEENSEADAENIVITLKDLAGNTVDMVNTDAFGNYSFDVRPGTYQICADVSAFPGFVFTAANVTGDDTNDSDVNAQGIIPSVTVAECGDINCNNDVGITPPPTDPATIEGYVWDELGTKDGTKSPNEPPLVGITVQLLDQNGFVINSMLTDENGFYQFANLAPNVSYQVQFIPPNLSTQLTVAGPDMDADASGQTTSLMPTNNETISDVDAGFCGLYSLGNLVFHDVNNDGLYNSNEPTFSNINVFLIDGTDGMTVLNMTMTDANGRYVFTELSAGDYIVEVAVPSGGYQSSSDIASTPMPNNLDSDDNGIGTTSSGNARSNVITLSNTAGMPSDANWNESDHGVAINGVVDVTSNPKAYYTMDFGFLLAPECSISLVATTDPTTCGGTDGSIALSFTNFPDGLYDLTYEDAMMMAQTFANVSITNGNATITGLPMGTYNNITISANGCTTTDDIDVSLTEPNAPTLTTTPSAETCSLNDGSIQVVINGGTAPFSVSWSDGGANAGTASNQNTPYVINNLPAGMYGITVSDASNCNATDNATVIAPTNCCPAISAASTDVTICEGQTITTIFADTDTSTDIEFVYFLTPQSGSSMYAGGTSLGVVSPNTGTATLSTPNFPNTGTFYVYAILNPIPMDAGCRPFQDIIVTINPKPNLNLVVSDPVICEGADAEIVISNSEIGISYQLRNEGDDSAAAAAVAGNGGDLIITLTGLTPAIYDYNIYAMNLTTNCSDELTDLVSVTVNRCDFPMFPPPNCPSPACHIIPTTPQVYFGSGVTADPGGSAGSNDVNDGINFPNDIRRSIDINLPITFYNNTGNPVYIQGWIDWDGDTNFDVDEQVANLTVPFDGVNLMQTISQLVSVPSNAIQDTDIAMRFRISTDPIIIGSPCGVAICAADGEVEDYLIQIECPEEVCLPVGVTIIRN